MAKGVLGNDPFLRGAAPRAQQPVAPPEQPARTRAGSSAKAPAKAPPRAKTAAQAKRAGRATPASEGRSPKPAKKARSAPSAHAASPEVAAQLGSGPAPHAASPELIAVDAEPAAHRASPELVAMDAEPAAHRASPELVAMDAEPAAHRASPELVAMDAEPAAHRASPELVALTADPAAAQPRSFSPGAAGALEALREVSGGLWAALASALGMSAAVDLDDYGRDRELVASLRPLFDFFYQRYWRIQVDGADHIPHGPAILVANHSGALPFDGPMVQQAVTRERPDLSEARWLVEDQVFHAPFLGTLGNRLGAIRACPENALRLLSEQRPLIVFPEGVQGIGKSFKERYHLKRFGRGGFVKIALRTGAPIIPVAVVGAEEAMPVLYKLPGGLFGAPYLPVTTPLPLPSRWHIRFGEPLDLGGATAQDAQDLPRVQRLTERTREAIQGMLTSLLAERPGVF